MASPNNGQPMPPAGYQLDVTPPSGYMLDSIPQQPVSLAPTPDKQVPSPLHPVVQQVLDENPGLAKNFNADNTSLVFADPDRSKRGLKERGGLEFWFPGDKGPDDFPSPDPTKNVLEIYDDKLKNDPASLKQAVYGDLMHGMSNDPHWNDLRTQFMQSFTPQEKKRQAEKKTWWDDVNNSKEASGPVYDAYIRGWIANQGEGKRGQSESKNTMYSPKQIEILKKMETYLKTGKEPPKQK